MPSATPVPPSDASEPSSLLSIVDRTAYDRLIKVIADDLPEATGTKFRGACRGCAWTRGYDDVKNRSTNHTQRSHRTTPTQSINQSIINQSINQSIR